MTEVQEKKGLGVRPSQLVAGALAAVTAAVLGSFFGVEGTVIGAGLASVISTVVSALYQASLERAKKAAKLVTQNTGALRGQSGTAVQQRPQRQQTQQAQRIQQAPAPRQPQPTMRPGQPTPTRAAHSSVYRPVDPNAQIASLATPLSEQRTQMMRPAQPQTQTQPDPAGPTEYMGPVTPETTERPWWLRRWKMLLGLTVAVFAIGIAVASGVELINGGTLSGDKGAPSITRVFSGDNSKKVDKQTPSDKNNTGSDTGSTATSTESTTTEDKATETTAPTTEEQGGQDGQGGQQNGGNPRNTGVPTPQQMPVPPTGENQPGN